MYTRVVVEEYCNGYSTYLFLFIWTFTVYSYVQFLLFTDLQFTVTVTVRVYTVLHVHPGTGTTAKKVQPFLSWDNLNLSLKSHENSGTRLPPPTLNCAFYRMQTKQAFTNIPYDQIVVP